MAVWFQRSRDPMAVNVGGTFIHCCPPPSRLSQGATMGLSTHVLDTMHGSPAAGMAVALYSTQGEQATLVKRFVLNGDGRNPDGQLLDASTLTKGTYRLVFDVS